MTDGTVQIERPELELPPSAPSVRITAGVGSANQKTWNVRRPVTLIGSSRPAHIALHDHDVTKAHCVIVNTGKDVLLKDLHTSSGTQCNNNPVDLVALKDGDVITVGGTRIQIAIRSTDADAQKDDSGCGMEFVEPTKFPQPIAVRLEHTDNTWQIEDAVVLLGRHSNAGIRIDHADVSTRHALVFMCNNEPAVFDLGSRTGVGVNGNPCAVSALCTGDRVSIGPLLLAIGAVQAPAVDVATIEIPRKNFAARTSPNTAEPPVTLAADTPGTTPASPSPGNPQDVRAVAPPPMPRPAAPGEAGPSPSAGLAHIEEELGKLQGSISDSWERLNRWQTQLREDAEKLNKQGADLSARETELDAKDAALRGQLHDLTRYHEQITARERELAAQLARIQSEQDKLTAAQADLVKRESEIARRTDELQRREHVLAQRWARLLAATCPHCGKALRPAGGKDESGG